MRRTLPAIGSIVVVAVLSLSSCSKGATQSSTAGQAGDDGIPTIEIKALDSLQFDPSSVDVKAGQEVRFVVTNVGTGPHEFVVGDEQMQMEHEGQMASGDQGMGSMGGMEDTGDLPALAIEPGQTEEAVVTIDEPGELLFGCHVGGHYNAGMKGTITVTS